MGHVSDEGTTDGGTPVLQRPTWLTQTAVLAHPAVKAWKAPQPAQCERDGLDLLAGPVDHGQSGIPSIFFA